MAYQWIRFKRATVKHSTHWQPAEIFDKDCENRIVLLKVIGDKQKYVKLFEDIEFGEMLVKK